MLHYRTLDISKGWFHIKHFAQIRNLKVNFSKAKGGTTSETEKILTAFKPFLYV